ncbi:MAG TPA: hypothetical protein VHH88_12625 [Verrucomicrobiae bacterium]|nr:hypothetical protein [Verrucomicrobiae bacterium]
MKTLSSREFFHSPTVVKTLRPGQTMAVTDRGSPSFTVVKAGKRPRKTIKQLKAEAQQVTRRKGLRIVEALVEMRHGQR